MPMCLPRCLTFVHPVAAAPFGHGKPPRCARSIGAVRCQAGAADSQGAQLDRRTVLTGAAALAASLSLQTRSQAAANQVLSAEWEKVSTLPLHGAVSTVRGCSTS